jgi:hypothetical protein
MFYIAFVMDSIQDYKYLYNCYLGLSFVMLIIATVAAIIHTHRKIKRNTDVLQKSCLRHEDSDKYDIKRF